MSQQQGKTHEGAMKYRVFFAMIATSTAVMFGLMYANTYAFDHVFFSETRFWMAFVMGAAMAVIMLAFMLLGAKDELGYRGFRCVQRDDRLG